MPQGHDQDYAYFDDIMTRTRVGKELEAYLVSEGFRVVQFRPSVYFRHGNAVMVYENDAGDNVKIEELPTHDSIRLAIHTAGEDARGLLGKVQEKIEEFRSKPSSF